MRVEGAGTSNNTQAKPETYYAGGVCPPLRLVLKRSSWVA